LESKCRALKIEDMQRRFGDDPHFPHALDLLKMTLNELDERAQSNGKLLSCYGENLDRIRDLITKTSTEQIGARYAAFKAQLFTNSMAFFSSLSEQMTQVLKRFASRMRGYSSEMKTSFVNFMRDTLTEKIYPILQSFVDKIDSVAKLLKVDTYSVGLNLSFINVGFTFKPSFGP
jgi:hypothetical protein